MSTIDPHDELKLQVERQKKIIAALMRRADRQTDVGHSAYSAFQSAIELHDQVAAKTRALEETTSELESVRGERERNRKNLAEALSKMEDGFALFIDRRLDICNELFQSLLPDIAIHVRQGLTLERYLSLLSSSQYIVPNENIFALPDEDETAGADVFLPKSVMVELIEDRWYQVSLQRTSARNFVLLMTEVTSIVRRNRREKENLIDRQADYLQAVFHTMSAGLCSFSRFGEVTMLNARFRDLLDLSLTAVEPDMPLEAVLDLIKSRLKKAERERLSKATWIARLNSEGWLRNQFRLADNRVLDFQANVLPDGGYLIELKDVTLETRTTEMLENRVMERTAELTHANERLTEEYQKIARVEEELRIAKERAEAAMSSKTRFLAAASHDLLQPINAAKLLISTLQETISDQEQSLQVNRLAGAFKSAEQLLHSLLDISRLESADPNIVKPTEVPIVGLLQGILADQSPVAEQKGIELRLVPCSAIVRSDPIYLLRSIQNLVVNAIQYTEEGGRILVGCRQRADRLVLQVWDTGIGIASEDQERIFEEFARASVGQIGDGVGLGLSVVERACRLLGHRLWVQSEPGKGSVFNIELETVAGRKSPGPIQPRRYEEDKEQLDCIVLIIENDEDVLFGTSQRLEKWGASVLAARSAEEALAFVRDMGMPPDIILADYHLDHDRTGIEAIAEIRQETLTHVPAIIITADRSELLRRQGVMADFSVLSKPVELSHLRQMIAWKTKLFGSHDETRPEPGLLIQTKVANDTQSEDGQVSVRRNPQ